MTRPIELHDLLNADAPTAPAISPDGRFVAYVLRSTNLGANTFSYSLRVLPADRSTTGAGIELAHGESPQGWSGPFQWCWSPDSSGIGILEPGNRVRVARPDGGEVWSLDPSVLAELDPAEVGALVSMKFSPDATLVALTASGVPGPAGPPPRTSLPIELSKVNIGHMYQQLFLESQVEPPIGPVLVLEPWSGQVREIGDRSIRVTGVGWVDSERLVLRSETDDRLEQEGRSVRYVVHLGTPADCTKLDESELDTAATVVSPDGAWVASKPLMPRRYFSPPSITKAGKTDVEMDGEWTRPMAWAANSTRLLFESQLRLSSGLFAITPQEEEPVRFTPEDYLWRSNFSFAPEASGGRGLAAFLLESPVMAPDVWVTPLDVYDPVRITDCAPQLRDLSWPSLETRTWRSPDDRFDIDGIVLVPPSGHEPPYPTVVEVVGGPAAVPLSYSGGHQFRPALFAARGMAVLLPSTRGRGGAAYPDEFAGAIEREGNQCQNPFGDLISGVESLVSEGVADPERLGIMGHSYGGVLTGWAVTQTDRFLAASAHEGAYDFPGRMFKDAGNPKTIEFCRRLSGYGNPMDPGELERIEADSPIYQAHKARTPILLIAGEKSGIAVETVLMAHAMEHNGVPYELRIEPRSGHVTMEPALIEDFVARNLAWFSYWLEDVPYPDAELQLRYDGWKAQRSARRSDLRL